MTGAAPICAVVPTFDNPRTVGDVVRGIREHDLDVVLVDDGSADPGRDACRRLADEGLVELVRLDQNRGKSAACVAGFRRALQLGFGRGFQIDADLQHDLGAIPKFVEVSNDDPRAMVAGYPVYDATAPRSRRFARGLTSFWVSLECGKRGHVEDALIGFRVYPLEATLALPRHGKRMQFDPEVAVRLVRAGTPVINLPVAVRYLAKDEGGVSHFAPLRDNLAYARMHARLCIEGIFGIGVSRTEQAR